MQINLIRCVAVASMNATAAMRDSGLACVPADFPEFSDWQDWQQYKKLRQRYDQEKADHQVPVRLPKLRRDEQGRREILSYTPADRGDEPWRHDADRDKHGQGRHDADRDPDDDPERGPQPSRSGKTQEAKQGRLQFEIFENQTDMCIDPYFVPSKGIREDVLNHLLNTIFGSRAKFRKSQAREGWVISNGKKVTNDHINQLRNSTELVNATREQEAAERQRKERSKQEPLIANRRPRILPDSERVSQEAPTRERPQVRQDFDTRIPGRTAQVSRKHTHYGPKDDDDDDDDDNDEEPAPPVYRQSYNPGSPSRHLDSTSVRGEVYNDRRPDLSSLPKRVNVKRGETATASRQPLTERRDDNSKDGRNKTGRDLRTAEFAEYRRHIDDIVNVSQPSLALEDKIEASFRHAEKEELTQRFARLSSNPSLPRRR
jgi:hypothetical protein